MSLLDVRVADDWFTVAESVDELIAELAASGPLDLICMTLLDSGGELWVRAGEIVAFSTDGPGPASVESAESSWDSDNRFPGRSGFECERRRHGLRRR